MGMPVSEDPTTMTDILLSGSSKKCFYNYSILPLVICLSLVLKAQGGHSLSLQHHGDGLNPAQADEESFPVPVSASSGLYKFGGSNPSHGGGVGAGQQWRPNVQYFMKLFRKSPSLKNEEPSEVADYSISEEQIEQGRPSLYQASEIEQRKRNEALGESRGLQLSILDNINTLRKGLMRELAMRRRQQQQISRLRESERFKDGIGKKRKRSVKMANEYENLDFLTMNMDNKEKHNFRQQPQKFQKTGFVLE